MIGVASDYTTSDFQDDLSKAQAAGIDAFGLNMAAQDPNTGTTVARMFAAAESMGGSIKLYLIFDYAAWGAWDPTAAANLINQYKTSPVYFKYKGKPLVSTFEGPANSGDWPGIKSSTGCFFIPDYSSVGAATASSYSAIDGLASWTAWPEGPNNMTTGDDEYYVSNLNGKPYMMGLSPWFYTDLPQYSKNWLWHADSLWHTRWLQTISQAPTFVQIISWNDYGESHYIGPVRPSGVVNGAWYVDSAHTHEAWLALLPKYIAAYRSGSTAPLTAAASDKLVYWYKTNPIASGSDGGTVGNNPNYQRTYPPGDLSGDLIFFTAQLSAPADISVTIGNNRPQQVNAGS